VQERALIPSKSGNNNCGRLTLSRTTDFVFEKNKYFCIKQGGEVENMTVTHNLLAWVQDIRKGDLKNVGKIKRKQIW
jgi:hypothetical protein